MTLFISQIGLKSISPCFSILSASALVVVANIYWHLHMAPADINILHILTHLIFKHPYYCYSNLQMKLRNRDVKAHN